MLELHARLFHDAKATLGECILWNERENALYWTDIQESVLWRHTFAPDADWSDGAPTQYRTDHWSLPERLGSFALCTRPGWLLLGLASRLALFETATGKLVDIAPVEADEARTRVNDGRCDPHGRFVFGMLNQASNPEPIGHFWRLDAAMKLERLPLPTVACANSIAFDTRPGNDARDPDAPGRMYFADSTKRDIHCCDYYADGRLGAPSLFATLPPDESCADGSTVDSRGGLWNAHWDGSRMARFNAQGVMDVHVHVPVSRLTCATFGGPDLHTLFMTSASVGLDDDTLRREPLAGGIFAVRTEFTGLPEHRFAGA